MDKRGAEPRLRTYTQESFPAFPRFSRDFEFIPDHAKLDAAIADWLTNLKMLLRCLTKFLQVVCPLVDSLACCGCEAILCWILLQESYCKKITSSLPSEW